MSFAGYGKQAYGVSPYGTGVSEGKPLVVDEVTVNTLLAVDAMTSGAFLVCDPLTDMEGKRI